MWERIGLSLLRHARKTDVQEELTIQFDNNAHEHIEPVENKNVGTDTHGIT